MNEVLPGTGATFTRTPAPLTWPFGKVIERHLNGREKKRAFFYSDAPNDYTRDDGPALIEYYEDGTMQAEHYFRDGELYREDGPAVIRYSRRGEVASEEWWLDGERRHSDFSERAYFLGGGVHIELWHTNYGSVNRRQGPARIEYRPDGSVFQEGYLRLGKYHRVDGPAQITREPDGSIEVSYLYLDGKPHDSHVSFLAVLDTWERERLIDELTDAGIRRPPYDPWTDEEDLGPDPLDSLPDEDLRAAVIAEHFPHLTADGVSPSAIATSLRGGVTSDEGIREVHAGAPVEWVRSYEAGRNE